MKRVLLIAVILGGAFALAVGLHSGLMAAAQGPSGWADTAAATCAFCHGG